MSRYLLDTTALVDFSKGREPESSRLLALIEGGNEIGVCAVCIAEFWTGLPPQSRSFWEEFITSVSYWETSREGAIRAGIYRYECARKGRAIPATDAIIAGTASQHGATIVTDDVQHYPMAGVDVWSLREGGTDDSRRP